MVGVLRASPRKIPFVFLVKTPDYFFKILFVLLHPFIVTPFHTFPPSMLNSLTPPLFHDTFVLWLPTEKQFLQMEKCIMFLTEALKKDLHLLIKEN